MSERRTISRWAGWLDAETRERCFTPAYCDLLQEHLEAQAGRRAAGRLAVAALFHLRVAWLAVECLRIRCRQAVVHRRQRGNTPEHPRYAQRRKGDGAMWLLWKDVRYGARGLLRSPGFTVVAVLTLALGIGANTAVFSVVNAVLLRSLPYGDADRLVAVWAHDLKQQEDHSYFSIAAVNDLRAANRSFESLTGFSPRWSFNLKEGSESERIYGFFASANFLETLGVAPLRGRSFTNDDDRAGAPLTAMVSYGLWQRRFGGDPGLVGRAINLDDGPVTVIGILPPDFQFLDGTARGEAVEIWLPLARCRRASSRRSISGAPAADISAP